MGVRWERNYGYVASSLLSLSIYKCDYMHLSARCASSQTHCFLLERSLETYRYLTNLKGRFIRWEEMAVFNFSESTFLLVSRALLDLAFLFSSSQGNYTVLLIVPLKHHAASHLWAFVHTNHSLWNEYPLLFLPFRFFLQAGLLWSPLWCLGAVVLSGMLLPSASFCHYLNHTIASLVCLLV